MLANVPKTRRHPWIPTREEILASRWIAPFAKYLRDENLWHFNRESVARGAAVGMFFGLIVPAIQTLFAVALAIPLRANVPISAAMTFITNPFTTPAIYYGAYRLGHWILSDPNAASGAEALQMLEQAKLDAAANGWWSTIFHWMGTVGPSLFLGLAILASVCAVLSYFAVHVFWRDRKHKTIHTQVDQDDH